MPKRFNHGVGAIAKCQKRYLHPSKVVNETLINTQGDYVVEGLIEIRKEVKKVNKRDQLCIVMRHDLFPNLLLHAVIRWVKVTSEGTAFFNEDIPVAEEQEDAVEEDGNRVPPPPQLTTIFSDIEMKDSESMTTANQHLRTLPINPIPQTTTSMVNGDGMELITTNRLEIPIISHACLMIQTAQSMNKICCCLCS